MKTPSSFICSRLSVALALLSAFSFSRAAPVDIDFELRSLAAPSRYEYTYTIFNNSFGQPLSWFSIDFNGALYDEGSLLIASSNLSDWSEQVLASVPGLPAQYDAFKATGPGLIDGDSLTGFKVEFTWLGAGAPGAQAFTVWDPATFDVLTTGVTTPVPEPDSSWLLIAGLSLVALRRCWRANRVSNQQF